MSNMLVYLSTSLLDHSITFVCVGSFLQSLENARARQLGVTINTSYCLAILFHWFHARMTGKPVEM